MSLWVDKYRPIELNQCEHVNAGVANHLKQLVKDGDCPHCASVCSVLLLLMVEISNRPCFVLLAFQKFLFLFFFNFAFVALLTQLFVTLTDVFSSFSIFYAVLFYGPPGSGKKSLVLALLSTIFGPGAHKTKVEQKTWKIDATSTRKIEVDLMTQSSNYHIEINPSDAGYKDRYVVQEVIKEMARSRPIDAQGNAGYKILVLTECDKLSKEAQHGLRRTMEKYSSACRLILIADSVNRVLEAVRSRCLPVRVAAPRAEEIEKVLYDIAAKEKLTLPPQLCSKVAVFAKRDMRRAILALEACRVANYPFKETQSVQTTDWELYIAQIAAEILAEQSPKRLLQVRGRIYELLVNCIPPTLIFQTLCFYLSKRLDDEMKHEVIRWSAHFEHKLQLGSKAIMHIEAFIAQFMATYKRKLISAFA